MTFARRTFIAVSMVSKHTASNLEQTPSYTLYSQKGRTWIKELQRRYQRWPLEKWMQKRWNEMERIEWFLLQSHIWTSFSHQCQGRFKPLIGALTKANQSWSCVLIATSNIVIIITTTFVVLVDRLIGFSYRETQLLLVSSCGLIVSAEFHLSRCALDTRM